MPEANTLAALVSIPSAIAVIATAAMFLKHMTDQRDKDRAAHLQERASYSAERAADRLIWENHLSKVTPILQSLVDQVSELRADMREKS